MSKHKIRIPDAFATFCREWAEADPKNFPKGFDSLVETALREFFVAKYASGRNSIDLDLDMETVMPLLVKAAKAGVPFDMYLSLVIMQDVQRRRAARQAPDE